MAPMKRPHESAAKNRDKTKRREYTSDADMIYKCLGKLCGEECEQDLIPVVDDMSRCHEYHEDVEMDAGTDMSDEDYDDQELRSTGPLKGVRHVKPKKKSDLTFKIGVQKAKRYICEALEFGVQTGYLTLKDSKGKLLKVSSDLLQTTDPSKNYSMKRTNSNEADTFIDRKHMRKPQPDSQERRNDKKDLTEARNRHKSSKKRRSRSRRGSRRRKSRSRSRRKHGRKRMGRSHSNNPELEARPKLATVDEIEQDELDSNSKPANSSNERNDGKNDDCKSIKSLKSNKSTPNSETLTNAKDKKHDEEDASNEDVSDDDDNKKK